MTAAQAGNTAAQAGNTAPQAENTAAQAENTAARDSEADRAFTAHEIAAALQISRQAVQQRAARRRWPYSQSAFRGGKRRLYRFSDLPLDVRQALSRPDSGAAARPDAGGPQPAARFAYDRESLWNSYARRPAKAKAEAQRRHALLLRAEALVDAGRPLTRALRAAAESDDCSGPRKRKTSWRTLRRWRCAVRRYDRADWLPALLPNYRGRAKTPIDPRAWDYLRADYLRPEQPTLAACYDRLLAAAREHGWTVPSRRTIARRIRNLPVEERVLLREGEHALLRRYPAQQRSVRDLRPGEWICGDGYRHNVFVRGADGRVFRPVTWVWADVYSRRILAWRSGETEHGGLVRLSLGDLIGRYGIPAAAVIDNTRAAANKWLTGGAPTRYRWRPREDDPLGLLPALGIDIHWTSVQAGRGWGQAKPVERAFGIGGLGEVVDRHPLLAGACAGSAPNAKPDNYGARAAPAAAFRRALDEGIRVWNARPGRRTEICAGQLSFDQAWEEAYRASAARFPTAEQMRMCMLAAEGARVARDGTVTLAAGAAAQAANTAAQTANAAAQAGRRNRYGADALLQFAGRRIAVRYDPARLHDEVHAYTLDGRYLCAAECIRAAGFGDAVAGREHARARRRKLRAVKEIARAEQRLDVLEAVRSLPSRSGCSAPPADATVVEFPGAEQAPARAAEEDLTLWADDLILAMAAEQGGAQ